MTFWRSRRSNKARVEQGADDERVIELARSDLRVLITEDKDFGQLTYATT